MNRDILWKTNALQAPPSCARVRTEVEDFVRRHSDAAKGQQRRIVLITSGGTTVPLEKNTVRFIDNFSTGSRGSKSAECFLEQEYAVIFMHRSSSMQPFAQKYRENVQTFFAMLNISSIFHMT